MSAGRSRFFVSDVVERNPVSPPSNSSRTTLFPSATPDPPPESSSSSSSSSSRPHPAATSSVLTSSSLVLVESASALTGGKGPSEEQFPITDPPPDSNYLHIREFYARDDSLALPPAPMATTHDTLMNTTIASSNNSITGLGIGSVGSPVDQTDVLDFVRSLSLDEKIISKIDHSSKFGDDTFEYRFVILPRSHPFFEFGDEQVRSRLLKEAEWRALGIKQTRGWEHIGVCRHESNILLFRRALETDPRTGRASPASQLNVERRERLEQKLHWISTQIREFDNNTNSRSTTTATTNRMVGVDDFMSYSERGVIQALPLFGSIQLLGPVDPRSESAFQDGQSGSPAAIGGGVRSTPSFQAIARGLAASIRAGGGLGIYPQPGEPFLTSKCLEYSDDTKSEPPIFQTKKQKIGIQPYQLRFIQDIDWLTANIHMPFFAL